MSKNYKRFTKDTALLQRIFLFAKNVLDAACKWYSRSSLWLLLLFPDKMHPSHLWHPSRSTTATLSPPGVVIVVGGVCVVINFVLSWFKIKPTSANATTSSSSKYAACCDDVAKTKMSSANLRSSKGWPPSSKSIPSVLTRILHLLRAHSNTEQNNLGLSAHPCLTPRRMSNSRLSPLFVSTCPRWLS